MKILAVDDDPIFLEILEETLKSAKFPDISCVDSGEDALAIINLPAVRFDCILLDVNMPEMDGVELCGRIRALHEYKQTPILMVTAETKTDVIQRAFDAGATDFFHKPIDTVELVARIRVAEELISRDRQKSQAQYENSVVQAHAERVLGIGLTDPIVLSGVHGVVGKLEFENRLLQRRWFQKYRTSVVAFAIAQFPELFSKLDCVKLYYLLEDVSEAISTSLTGTDPLLSYYGSGEFVCAFNSLKWEMLEDIHTTIENKIIEFDLASEADGIENITVLTGDVIHCSLRAISQPLKLTEAALISVGEKHRKWRFEPGRSASSMSKSILVAG